MHNLSESYRWIELKEFNDNLKILSIYSNNHEDNINIFDKLYDIISNEKYNSKEEELSNKKEEISKQNKR